MTNFTDRYTTWHLAAKAEVSPPDTHDGIGFIPPCVTAPPASPGARFLRLVAENVVVAIEEHLNDVGHDADLDNEVGDLREVVREAANDTLPVYSADIWRTWNDLALWAQLQDVADTFGGGGDWLLGLEMGDTDRLALLGLLMVAERLGESIMDDMMHP